MILPLNLENVSFLHILHPLSLQIEAGPSTIILGANGAGKSVLMRLMHGLLAPSSGTILWNSTGRQAMVFQRPVMLRRSALANIEYALDVNGVSGEEARRRASEALDRVGLAGADGEVEIVDGGLAAEGLVEAAQDEGVGHETVWPSR